MILQNILRKVVLAGAFLAPLVVFIIFNDMFFPFITGKNFVFRVVAEIMFAAWLVLAYMNSAYRPKRSAILWTLTAFVGIIFLADMLGENPYKSFWSNYERMEGFVGLLHFFFYFLAASAVLTSEKLWERWFQVSVAASVLMSMYGILQLAGTFDISQSATRIDGRFGNSAYMAVYLLVHIFLAAFLFARAHGKAVLRYLYGLAIVLEIVMLFYTQTRGSIVGLFVGAFLTAVLIAIFEKKNILARRIALGGVVAVVLVVGGFFAMKDSSLVQSSAPLKRLADISLTETTTKSRFMVWDMALSGWKGRPILGWGQENFNFVFNKYYNPGMYAQEQWFDRAHNIFFDWLVAGGLLGLLAYLSLFFVLIYYIWHSGASAGNVSFFGRIKHWFAHLGHTGDGGFTIAEKSVLTGLLAAYFIHNFFVFDNLGSYIFFFSLLAYFHHRVLAERGVQGETALNTSGVREPLPAILAVLVVLLGAMYFVNARPVLANKALIGGLQPQSAGLATNLEALKKTIQYHTFGTSEAREQLVQTAVRVKELNAPPEVTQQFFDFAKQEILLQNERFPGDARYESFAAILFTRFGQLDDALAHLEKAHELSPKKQTIDFDLIGVYLNKKEFQKALALAKEAYEMEPNFIDAAQVYAIAAIYAGDQKLADEILLKNFGTTVVEDDNLVNAYGATGQFAKAVAILELRVKNNPNNPEAHLRLAAGYSELGQPAKAIAELRKVIELQPEFKQQGEAYIQQLQAGKKP